MGTLTAFYLILVCGLTSLPWIPIVNGYSSGAADQACPNLQPWHSGTRPSTLPSPFVITVSKTTYAPRDQITVTIQACPGYTFKGFLIQPRLVQYYEQDVKVGVFGNYLNSRFKYACPDTRLGTRGQALTHTEASDKTNMRFVWQAPQVPQGHVLFRATIVQQFSTYWMGVSSPVVYDQFSNVRLSRQQIMSLTTPLSTACNQAANSTTSSPMTTTTITTTTTTTTTPKPTTTTTTPTTTTTTTPTTTTTTTPTTTTTTPTTTTTTTPTTTTTTITTTTPTTTTTTPTTTTTTPTTTTPTTTTTEPITTRPSTTPNIPDPGTVTISPDMRCNVTRGCHHDCRGRYCTFIIGWVDKGDSIDFEIKAAVKERGDRWIAVGFSFDRSMGSDSVTECVTTSGYVNVFQSFNKDTRINSRLRNPKLGLSNEGGSFMDGVFTCRFTRQKVVTSDTSVYDLNKDWHILFAQGTAMAGMKLPHIYNPAPYASVDRVDFQQYLLWVTTTTTTTTTTTPLPTTTTTTMATTTRPPTTIKPSTTTIALPTTRVPDPLTSLPPVIITTDQRTEAPTTPAVTEEQYGDLTNDLACGINKGCYEKCTGDVCRFIVSWRDRDDAIDFELRSRVDATSDRWMAVGFSNDGNMGTDSVVECLMENGILEVQHSYNHDDKTNHVLAEPGVGISNIGGRLENGLFTCRFTREKVVPGHSTIFDLNMDYHIMFAQGRVENGEKSRHSLVTIPSVSGERVDLQQHILVTSEATYFLVKVHGCLMIFAWIFCASIGIITVRFYKKIWPDKTICRERIWYQVHRFCMILVVLCVLVAVVLIFSDIKGFSKIDGKTFHKAHPVIGIIVTLFTIANPIVAVCRPLPGTVKRKIFNWIHWGLGSSAHILAIINIFAGVELSKAGAPSYMKYALLGYVAYLVLIYVLLEFHQCIANKSEHKRNQTYLYEMHRKPYNNNRSTNVAIDLEPPYSRMKKAIMGSHILITFAVTLIFVIIVIIS
ncbi:ferric-chelate reductase 1-like isoform X2 [Pecten maximus]|uniref:ferric-chelate reductase 1-like isoform X2 n=1 Tax=Pecten maximus TaxID=6579 RepID=UPI00145901BA|nr:ferric-chelate reductase 1-like isoform X2 [Pecten maximus]